LWRAVVEGSCGGQLWRAVVEGSCGGQLWRAVVEGSCGGQLKGKNVGKFEERLTRRLFDREVSVVGKEGERKYN
jgi:hypothetical protein